MLTNTFKKLRDAVRVLNGTVDLDQGVEITGRFRAQVIRNGEVIREIDRMNIVTYKGLNRLAYRAVTNAGSLAAFLAIGTQTAAHSLGSVQAGIGEVGRKIGVTSTQSQDFFTVVATWAGNADGLTGIAIDTGAISDYVNSSASTGIIYNAANGLGVTLQASDFLNLTASIRCGSHNLGQTT